MDHDRKSFVLGGLIAVALSLAATDASGAPIGISHAAFPTTVNHAALVNPPPQGETIIGIASFYDTPGELTSSGEFYDGNAFTAAAQIDIRDKFGGIRFGRLYQPQYGIAIFKGKRAILKFNDVGPLRPGRKFDLSRAAMEFFGGLDLGLLPDFKVVLLPPGQHYTPGPLADVPTAEFGDALVSDENIAVPPVQYVNFGPPDPTLMRNEPAVAAPAVTEDAPAAVQDAAPTDVALIDLSLVEEIGVVASAEADNEIVSSINKPEQTSTVAWDDVIDNCSN